MREVDRRFKVQAESLPEIKRGLRNEAERLSDEGVRFQGHVVWPGNLLNAVLCWFLDLGPAERERIAAVGMRAFEEHLASDQPAPFGRSAGGDPDPVPRVTSGHGPGPLVKPPPKSNRGTRRA
jgi:hypothetical protein